MKGEYIGIETARELHQMRSTIKKAIKYIEKDDIAIGKFDKIKLLQILRGDSNGVRNNTNNRISK